MSNIFALIIDDNSNNILVIDQLLRIEGVQTKSLRSATSLEVALKELNNIAIIFLDLEMPDLNGYEALSIIKSHPNTQGTTVVAYSVYVSELDNVLEQGFDAFIGKPLDAEAFPNQLERILNGETVRYIP